MKRTFMKGGVTLACLLACGVLGATVAEAASMKLSLGIRETGTTAAIFGNGGSSGGIEWVNKDGQTLNLDGSWQLFTFTPATDVLTGFAGASANGTLDGDTGTIEHIRILNDEGLTVPFRIWIDDVTNTVAAGPVVENFDSAAVGTEVMLNEPDFSGSTSGKIVPGGTPLVTGSTSLSGSQSLELASQFNSSDPTGWLRWTTFNAANLPNAAVVWREAGAANPTISFWARGVAVPEPTSLLLMGLGCLGLGVLRSRS